MCGLKECHVLTFTPGGSVQDHIALHPQLETGSFHPPLGLLVPIEYSRYVFRATMKGFDGHECRRVGFLLGFTKFE